MHEIAQAGCYFMLYKLHGRWKGLQQQFNEGTSFIVLFLICRTGEMLNLAAS
jgi:hypothetical protein